MSYEKHRRATLGEMVDARDAVNAARDNLSAAMFDGDDKLIRSKRVLLTKALKAENVVHYIGVLDS